jgi:hypothetical protein
MRTFGGGWAPPIRRNDLTARPSAIALWASGMSSRQVVEVDDATGIDSTFENVVEQFRAVAPPECYVSDSTGVASSPRRVAQDRTYSSIARLAFGTELNAGHSARWTTGVVAEHEGDAAGHRACRACTARDRRASSAFG